MIEWILETPKQKEFRYTVKRTITNFVVKAPGTPENPGTTPLLVEAFSQIEEPVTEIAPANIVRFTEYHNDKLYNRLTVRFVYGRMLPDGAFQGAYLDDGIVFSGPTYDEHEFHKDIKDEKLLMQKVASFLKWDGSMTMDGE